jgi:hypothetical protein
MKLYITIVFDPNDGPYVARDDTCPAEADCNACELRHETGHKVIVKCVDLSRS